MFDKSVSLFFQPINNFITINNKALSKYKELIGQNLFIADLLLYMPRKFIDRSKIKLISQIAYDQDESTTLNVRIIAHKPPTKYTRKYTISCEDISGKIDLLFFNVNQGWLKIQFPPNKQVIIFGKINCFKDKYQIVHPKIIEKRFGRSFFIVPIYALTQGIKQEMFYKIFEKIVPIIPDLPEWIDKAILDKYNWPNFKQAIINVHNPNSMAEVQKSIKRLAFDEALNQQISMYIAKKIQQKNIKRNISNNKTLQNKLVKSLPFELTDTQKQAIIEIEQDMQQNTIMLRLLQGDVGSGKTIVALAVMLNVVENNQQAAIIAPTEILAKQHAKNIEELCSRLNVKTALIYSKSSNKEKIKKQIINHEVSIIIGTHALLQDTVVFNNLSFIVVDEQHKFGVEQRLQLINKGKNIDVLLMTATPIPRSMALVLYNDMNVSYLDKNQLNRMPVSTYVVPDNKLDKIINMVTKLINDNKQIYWVCAHINSSEDNITAAEDRFNNLRQIFGNKVGLVHGKKQDNFSVIDDFIQNKYAIIVTTTVIEVGIDVPNASAIIIEDSHNFGLSQLHQLRGRVGRNDQEAWCILVYKNNISDIGRMRLQIMKHYQDGFKIAEEDFKLRGPGNILGTQQSGMPVTKILNIYTDIDIIKLAYQHTQNIIKLGSLDKDYYQTIKTLLSIFNNNNIAINILSG